MVWPLRIDNCNGWRLDIKHVVVIGNNDIDAKLICPNNFFGTQRTAVDRNNELCPVRRNSLYRIDC